MKSNLSINEGFTLIEVILSLFIVSFSSILLTNVLYAITQHDFTIYFEEDNTSIKQMQLLYALSKDFNVEYDTLSFIYGEDEMFFEVYDDKLILTPGYQVYLKDLDYVEFDEEGDCIYIEYEHTNNEKNKRIIGCQ